MAARKKSGGGRSGKGRVIVLLLALVVLTGAFFVFVGRDGLPEALRKNAVIIKTYRLRDALLSGPAAETPADPEKKQLGYPKDDRKKLENLIGTETKNETETK